MNFRQVVFFIMLFTIFSCEKKVNTTTPVVVQTTKESVEVEISSDIPEVNSKLKTIKTDLEKTMDKRESGLGKIEGR